MDFSVKANCCILTNNHFSIECYMKILFEYSQLLIFAHFSDGGHDVPLQFSFTIARFILKFITALWDYGIDISWYRPAFHCRTE